MPCRQVEGYRTYINKVDESVTNTSEVSFERRRFKNSGTYLQLLAKSGLILAAERMQGIKALTNAQIHEVVVTKARHVNDLLQLGLSDTVGDVAKHDLHQVSTSSSLSEGETYSGANVSAGTDA